MPLSPPPKPGNKRVVRFRYKDLDPIGVLRGTVYVLQWWTKDAFNDPCVYCGGKADTKEHVIPVSQGGGNDWSNVTVACRQCNMMRGNTPLLTFLLQRLS
jgi:hypothetical protein